MPEFILDMGDLQAAHAFNTLDGFTRGYIEAMFFTETGHAEDEELEHASVAELAPGTLAEIKRACAMFQMTNAPDLAEAFNNTEYDAEAAGRDFWYSRNGHGVGFWDRGLGEVGERLHKLARHNEVTLYRGDDNLLYIA
jgi:hypothetical protein